MDGKLEAGFARLDARCDRVDVKFDRVNERLDGAGERLSVNELRLAHHLETPPDAVPDEIDGRIVGVLN